MIFFSSPLPFTLDIGCTWIVYGSVSSVDFFSQTALTRWCFAIRFAMNTSIRVKQPSHRAQTYILRSCGSKNYCSMNFFRAPLQPQQNQINVDFNFSSLLSMMLLFYFTCFTNAAISFGEKAFISALRIQFVHVHKKCLFTHCVHQKIMVEKCKEIHAKHTETALQNSYPTPVLNGCRSNQSTLGKRKATYLLPKQKKNKRENSNLVWVVCKYLKWGLASCCLYCWAFENVFPLGPFRPCIHTCMYDPPSWLFFYLGFFFRLWM